MREFVYEAPPSRVVCGAGALARVPDETSALGLRRVLVIAGGSAAAAGDHLVAALGDRAAGRFAQVAQHVPEHLAAGAADAARAAGADGLCSVGGGSATGLAKAVAVALDLPVVAVPTTYAGSEATPVYGLTGTRKRTARDPRARPRTVVYDPTLSVGLPARATAASAFNALAHAAAALAGPAPDPVARLYAAEAVRLVTGALPAAARTPGDLDARGDLLWAAWLAGSAFAATGAGLHHRLCHVVGGSFGLAHAEVHATLLPHTLAADPALDLTRLGAALGGPPAAVLADLARRTGAPRGLARVGLRPEALDEAAAEAAATIGTHDRAWFRDLLDRAYHHTERSSS
jgi:maleylacetate reductase